MKDKLIVFSVAVLSLFSVWADVPVTDGLVGHLDASAWETTMTLGGNGEVTEWCSPEAGGMEFYAPASMKAVKNQSPLYCNGIPYLTEEDGLKAVWFGTTWGSETTNRLMAARTAKTGVLTAIAVSRQHVAKRGGALFGNVTGSSCRLLRNSSASCEYGSGSWATWWINMTKGTLSFADVGGIDRPHVVTATRTTNTEALECIGGAYLWNSTNVKASDPSLVYAPFSLHEILFYNRVLSDDEIAAVQEYLMVKWDVGNLAVWTGEGETTDWNDADNWMNGKIPTAGSTVCLKGGQVTASGACLGHEIVGSGATLTMASGATLRVTGTIDGVTFAGKGDVSCAGTITLPGARHSFASLGGWGTVTAADDASATVVLDTDAGSVLKANLTGAVSLEKRGEGELSVGFQQYGGGTTVAEGELKTVAQYDYSRYGKVSVNLDASDLSSFTLDAEGNVLRWNSQRDGNVSFISAAEAHPEQPFVKGYTYRMIDDQGRPCVRFGCQHDNSYTGSYLVAEQAFRNTTLFFVSRQHAGSPQAGRQSGTLAGNLFSTSYRIIRTTDYFYTWAAASVPNNGKAWISGEARDDDDLTYETAGSHVAPHVFALRRGNSFGTCDTIGANWLRDGESGALKSDSVLCARMDLYEVLAFDAALTDEQVEEISAALVAKWSCPELPGTARPRDILPTGTAVEVGAEATLDLGNVAQDIASLGGSGTVRSGRELSVESGIPAAGSLQLDLGGLFDLRGASVTVSTFEGRQCVVTNTSEAQATLTVANDADSRLEAKVTGDVALVKSGTGELLVSPGQTYSGTTTLGGGVFRAKLDEDFETYGTVIAHLDASKPETLTLNPDNGDILAWQSLSENGLVFRSAVETCPNYDIRKGYPFTRTDENGFPCVRFGWDRDNNFTGSFLRVASTYTARTFFIVNRQLVAKSDGGALIGTVVDVNGRIIRDSSANNTWMRNSLSSYQIDGIPDTLSFAHAGTERPFLLVAVTDRDYMYDSIGTAYAMKTETEPTALWKIVYGQEDVYELLAFKEVLTAEQIAAISAVLMKKWNIAKPEGSTVVEPANTLSPNTTYLLTADSTLDCAYMQQPLNAIGLAAGDAEAYPCFTVARPYLGVLDLTEIPLTMSDNGKLGTLKQDILRVTAGTVAGPFASVEGAKGNLRYKQDRVCISNAGMLLLVR